jgi:curved DNA-binding protein CbpA
MSYLQWKMGKMRCHYEVLGVSRDVDQDELKKSYRKMALKVSRNNSTRNIPVPVIN